VTIVLKPNLATNPTEKPPIVTDQQRAEAEKKAVEAAEPWLKLLDKGQYSQSWEVSAEYLKAVADRRNWIKMLNAIRKPFGDVVSRELKSKQFTTTLPGMPDGQYVVIEYQSSFAKRKSIIETVTPMLDKDKKWRVSGYYVK
jgi:hypothetical protein